MTRGSNETVDVGLLMGRKTVFEVPPPGVGFTTVIQAVLACPVSEERM